MAGLRREITEQPGARIAIDLERQVVTAPSGTVHHFGIDPFRKQCLLQGVAEIELTPVTATRSRHSSDGRPAN
ncbi:MAG TPA: hypothetical protein VK281_12370 [Xanthobacteraceae bacterium]|nr:hypothetical protein [Xanthobacteraceae bacterium]